MAEEVTRTSAYAEGVGHLREAERQLEAWKGLRREAEARHGMRARLGLVGQLQVVSPETRARVRLGEGIAAAFRRQAQAKEALASMARSPAVLAEAKDRAQAARRGQVRTQADLLATERQFQQANSLLKAVDRAHPDLAKLQVLIQHGHVSEVAQLHAQGRRAHQEARCHRLMQRQEELEGRTNGLRAGRLVPTMPPSPGEHSKNSPHAARQKSRSKCRQDRAIERLEAQTTGLRAKLERALQGLHQYRERHRYLSRDMGRSRRRCEESEPQNDCSS